jgi:hypothetical protein
MAETYIMLHQATGFREMYICERFSSAFHILPSVGVFVSGVTASEGIFHLSADITQVIKMREQCAGWVFKIRHSRSAEKPGEKPARIVKGCYCSAGCG